MDASRDRAPQVDRVAEIRAEIEAARTRVAETVDALRFKADLPARLGDSMGNAASTFTTHLFDGITGDEGTEAADEEVTPASSATTAPSDSPGLARVSDVEAGQFDGATRQNRLRVSADCTQHSGPPWRGTNRTTARGSPSRKQ